MSTWEKFEEIKEIIGVEELLVNLAKAMGDYELEDSLNYIARMFDMEEILTEK